MSTRGADFNHYAGRSIASTTPDERRRSLAELVSNTRAKASADEETREKISQANHEELLRSFRIHIQNSEIYTPEEKADIIARSFEW